MISEREEGTHTMILYVRGCTLQKKERTFHLVVEIIMIFVHEVNEELSDLDR